MQLQLVEVAIGVVASYFLVAVMASAAVELASVLFQKRSKDLKIVLDTMLSTKECGAIALGATSLWQSNKAASRRKRGARRKRDKRTPSYLSAKSFADGVVEGLVTKSTVDVNTTTVDEVIKGLSKGPLQARLTALRAEAGDDLVAVKAGLEGWFDDTMDRMQGAYKRWSQWFLLLFGLTFALALNVSTVRIVGSLWNDATLRTAVADSAATLTAEPCPTATPNCKPEDKLDNAIKGLDSLKLPVGWSKGWSKQTGAAWTLLGILPTGLAAVMGAPFWFDLLTRLVGSRGNRGVPPKASADSGSATAAMATCCADRTPKAFFGVLPTQRQ